MISAAFIAATDLAHHFRIKPDLEKLVADGYNTERPDHRSLLLSLLMTACDLSDQAKDWDNSRETAVSHFWPQQQFKAHSKALLFLM